LVVVVLEAGDADELALEVVGPAVVGAHEGGRMPFFGPADGVAAVTAGVEEDLGVALLGPDGGGAVLTDGAHEEIAGTGDLALVDNEVPAAGEDLLQLLLVYRLVRVNPAIDCTFLGVDQLEEFGRPG